MNVKKLLTCTSKRTQNIKHSHSYIIVYMLKNITWWVNMRKEMKNTFAPHKKEELQHNPTNLIVMTCIFLILEASTPTFHL